VECSFSSKLESYGCFRKRKLEINKTIKGKTNLNLLYKFKFLKKTFLNFGSSASNTARSAGTAALCEAKGAILSAT